MNILLPFFTLQIFTTVGCWEVCRASTKSFPSLARNPDDEDELISRTNISQCVFDTNINQSEASLSVNQPIRGQYVCESTNQKWVFLPCITYLHRISSVTRDTGSWHVQHTLLVVDPPDPETTAPPEPAPHITRHLLTREHSRLVIPRPNTPCQPIRD